MSIEATVAQGNVLAAAGISIPMGFFFCSH